MSNILKSFLMLLVVASCSSVIRQPIFPGVDFHAETEPPQTKNDFFEGSFTIDRHPVQVSGGIRLKPPFRLPHFLPPMHDIDFSRESRMPFFFPLPLFTPNTVRRPAATKGQVEEFNKALEEEEMEKKKQDTNGSHLSKQYDGLEDFGSEERNLNYVSVRSNQYNYNYTL